MDEGRGESRFLRGVHPVWWVLGVLGLVIATGVLIVVVRVRTRDAMQARFARFGCELGVERVGPKWLRQVVHPRIVEAFSPIRQLTFTGKRIPGGTGFGPLPTALDDESLGSLVDELERSAEIESLAIAGPASFGNRGFRELRRLHELQSVTMLAMPISDAALGDVADDWPLVAELELLDTPIGDAAAKEIARLPQLTYLRLDGTEIGDDGAAHLAKLPRLKSLSLTRTYVTEQGIATLVGRIPDLQVSDD